MRALTGLSMAWVFLAVPPSPGRADNVQLAATRSAACAVAKLIPTVDLIPDGESGVAIRITSSDPKSASRQLAKLWPSGPPSGVSGVVIDTPRPKLAIILDDFGLHRDQLGRVWGLAEPLTYAILPGQAHSERYADWLRARGASILAHIPMEPNDSAHMTLDGFLTIAMTTVQRTALLRRHIAAIPGAIGWNNHMGSRLTSDPQAMRALVASTPKGDIIIDSRTSPQTVLESMAREFGHSVGRRHVFIDNLRQEQTIYGQLLRARAIARAQGHAIAIGHAYPETARAIHQFMKSHADSVQLVPIERVVTPALSPAWAKHCRPAGVSVK